MDAREKDSGRWLDMWCLLLTFPKLPVGGLLVRCSLPGPPVSMQMVTMVPGQGGRFQCASPNNIVGSMFLCRYMY